MTDSSQLVRHQSGYSCLWGSDSNYFLLVLLYYWLVFAYERHGLLPKGLATENRTNRAKEENASGGASTEQDMSDGKGKHFGGKGEAEVED